MSEAGVGKTKQQHLEDRMRRLGVRAEDLDEKFVMGSGPGGQKVNKTSSCVFLRHTPSGIEIKCQQGRSQSLNRYYARVELCDRLQERDSAEKTARQKLREKIRRQKRRRSRRQKERILHDKRRQSEKKAGRRPADLTES